MTKWSYIVAGYGALFFLGLLDNGRGPFFADIMRDLGLNNWQGSMSYAIVSLMAYFVGVRVATLSHRFGTIYLLRAGLFVMGSGYALIATAQSLAGLIFFCALYGVGFGVLNVAQNLVILEATTGALRRRFFSGLHGMYAFASLVAPLICAELFRRGSQWRVGIAALGLSVACAFILSFVARNHKLPANIEPSVGDVASLSTTKGTSRKSLFQKYFWPVMLMSFYVLAEVSLATRLPLYLRVEKGFNGATASSWLAYFFVAMLIGRLTFLAFHFRWKSSRIILVCLMLTFLAFALGLALHPAFLIFCGLTLGPIFGMFLDCMTEFYPRMAREAIAYSIGKSSLFIVAMHMLTGFLSDAIGVGKALALAPLYLLIAIFALFKVEGQRQISGEK